MGFLDRFRKAPPAPVEQKSLVTMTPQVMRWFDMLDATAAPTPGLRPFNAYATFALAYACMNFRAAKTVEPRLWLAKETEDGEDWLDDHELGPLLETPNPDMDMSDLLEFTSLYLDATGSCVWLKNRDVAGRVGSLYPYSGDDFTVRTADGRLYGEFTVNTASGSLRVPPSEVVYFRRSDPRDLHNGLGPLEAALAHVNIGNDMRRAITASLKNAIRPGAVLETTGDDPLTDAEFERLKETSRTEYAGVVNDGKLMLTERAKIQFLESSLKKLELGPMQGDVEAAICQCFTIHPGLVGARIGLENAGGMSDSIAPALDLYYDLAQKPIWNRIERTLTRQLLREVDADPTVRIKFDLSHISALEDDVLARATEASTAGKFWTVNEGRTHTGQQALDPTDPRGEEFIDKPAPPPQIVDPNAADPNQPAKDAPVDMEAKAIRRHTHALMEAHARDLHDATLELMAADALAADKARVEHAIGMHSGTKDAGTDLTAEERKAIEERALQAIEQGKARWERNFRPTLSSVANQAVRQAGSSVGVSFDLLQPGLLDYVEREAAFLITNVSDTTKAKVQAAIQDGLQSGEGLAGVAKRIEDAGAFSRDRAQLIATTEVTRTRNGAAREQLQKYADRTGLKTTKEWINSADERVRHAHRDKPEGVGTEKVAIDQPFSNGLMQPSEPNCRCSLLYDVEV